MPAPKADPATQTAPDLPPDLPPGRHLVRVAAPDAGERLDRFLASRLPGLSRSRVKALIEAGRVGTEAESPGSGAGAGGETISEPSRRVKPGESFVVTIPESAPATPRPQSMELVILYEDADLLVLDKPPGLVVHPAPGNPDRTLVNALLAHCGDSLSGIGGVRRPGIVHRLDKDTSGIMVVAKNDAAHRGLSAQFAAHSIHRAYKALVWGAPQPRAGLIDGNIGRSAYNRKKMAVVARGGKPARTRYRTVESFGDRAAPAVSLVVCELLTGRTHQVRVHLSSRGHPLVGDATYGRPRKIAGLPTELMARLRVFPRQALHAYQLAFIHPQTGKEMQFETELTSDLKELISLLRL